MIKKENSVIFKKNWNSCLFRISIVCWALNKWKAILKRIYEMSYICINLTIPEMKVNFKTKKPLENFKKRCYELCKMKDKNYELVSVSKLSRAWLVHSY